jgi:hypothetical protein
MLHRNIPRTPAMQPELFHFAYPAAMSSKAAIAATLVTSAIGMLSALAFGFIA